MNIDRKVACLVSLADQVLKVWRGYVMTIDEFLTEIIPVHDPQLRECIKHNGQIETYGPMKTLSCMGEEQFFVRFLIRGSVWGYMFNSRGKETTVCFVTKPGEVLYGADFLGEDAANITLETLTESEIFSIPVEEILKLRLQYPEIEDIYLNIMISTLQYHWRTKKMLYLKTARERYEWFLEEYPGLIDKVNHNKIASFLNITPVTLSRIRTARGS